MCLELSCSVDMVELMGTNFSLRGGLQELSKKVMQKT